MKKLIVIDGNSIMFRAYYATAYTGNLMQARSGIYTNAIYGFVNMINHIVATPDMTNIFVAFDKGKKTLRHQAYADYKAGRSKTPDEFLMQIPYIKEYLDVVGIKHLELDDYEADDIVGSMAVRYKDEFDEVMVISGDHDLLQLAKDNIHVYLTIKGLTDLRMYSEENFPILMGFESKYMCDFKGLIGDKSDNLPGITGVGEKTAIKLINEYGTLEDIIGHVDDLKGKLQENIINDKDLALRSKKLATIYTDVDLGVSLDETIYHKPKNSDLRSFYERFDFVSFIKKLGADTEIEEEPVIKEVKKVINYHISCDIDLLKEQLHKADCILMEAEIAGENYHKDELLGFSIVVGSDGYFIDFPLYSDDELIKLIESKKIYAVDAKKLICALYYIGINLKHIEFDLTLGAYIVNPAYSNTDIKNIYEHFMTVPFSYSEEVYNGKGKKKEYAPEIYGKYAIDKAAYLSDVKIIIDEELKKNDQSKLLYEMELPLASVLAEMELNGFKINPLRLKEIGETFKMEMDNLEQEIYKLCGEEFNIGSPKQLGVILFEKLQIAKGKKNKTGYSTSAEELEKLALIHPVPRKILDYRKYSKLYSTYVTGLLNEISSRDGKVHTIFKQALTLTGRLSSTEPNIQNIPIRTDDGRLIRSAFVTSFEDGLLISADYSQIELRVLSHMADCKHMKDAFIEGVDLHASTAAKVFNVAVEDVSKDQRRMAKAVNFGIVYGMSPWGLAEEIHTTAGEAAAFIERYFEIYPEIKTYLDGVVNNCKQNGYTTTLYNRRRYIPDINSSNGSLRQFAERTAKNAPIQGSAADIIKVAMINVDNRIKELNLRAKFIAQVHDELVLDVPHDEIEIIKNLLKEQMESVIKLNVPLNAEVSFGTNWDMK